MAYFIAFPITSEQNMESIISRLPIGVVPTRSEDLHATISYLGQVHEELAAAAFEHAIQHAPNPMDCFMGPMRLLGSSKRPRAVTASLEDPSGILASTILALRNVCRSKAGVAPEERDVLPHVTIGAISYDANGRSRERISSWVREQNGPHGFVRLDEIALFTHGDSRGTYRVVARENLFGK